MSVTTSTWLFLLSLLCVGAGQEMDRNGPENGVLHCGAQNMMLNYSDQMILLKWEDNPSCSTAHEVLIYEVLVLLADQQLHEDKVVVKPDQMGFHSWNWTSHLLTECTSVRLRSRYKSHEWMRDLTPTRKIKPSDRPEVFPKDKVFEVGSRVTFCCFLPPGKTMNLMRLNNAETNPTNISAQMYVMTVDLNTPSVQSCTNIICEITTKEENGACVYIGYRPADRNLQCETRDLQSVFCHWTTGRKTHLHFKSPTVYRLLGRECIDAVVEESEGKCSEKVEVKAGERNWTLTAQNDLGTLELTDRADLTKRVNMFAPKDVTASDVTSRNVSLEWKWTEEKYNNLNIVCQIQLSHSGQTFTRNNSGVGLRFTVVNDLIPSETYAVQVRCGAKQDFWKWGDWSSSTKFHTRGDIPDALDVWMQMEHNQTLIIWKMLQANQSHGQMIDYKVTWTKSTEPKRQHVTSVKPPDLSVSLSLDTNEEHVVTVTARNVNGSSFPSAITIPRFHPDRVRKTSKISGRNGGFRVSWSASPAAECGYVLEWCRTFRCRVDWLKVPPGVTDARIIPENFQDGWRYSLSIYACTPGAPMLLERREGYIRETRLPDKQFDGLEWKQLGSDVQVSWTAISPDRQTAFIQGYILYYQENSAHPDHPNPVFSITTDNPEVTSLTARQLQISSYTFTVKALTSVGECGDTSIAVTMNSLTDNLISAVVVSLVGVFALLSLIAVLCYRNWACVKEKIYPPVPKPVLTDSWSTSLVGSQKHKLIFKDDKVQTAKGFHSVFTFSEMETKYIYSSTVFGHHFQVLALCVNISV
ncbi:hypothetical protein LDENG_00190580, partial [Lucifuga dentata]